MTEDEPADDPVAGTREVMALSRGARFGLLIGAVLVVAAAVAWWWPLERLVPPAPPIPCGTAAAPVTAQPAAQLCGELADRNRVLAGGLLCAAVVVAIGSALAFGSDRRTQVAPPMDD